MIIDINRRIAEHARIRKKMDEAAEHINNYLQEIPANP